MTQIAFILSSGRTGTTFLAEFLNQNFNDIYAVHEPPPSYHLRMLSNARLAGRVSTKLLRRALMISRRGKLRSIRAGRYVESNPFLFGFVEVLDALGPNPLILHIVRDPREFVRSALNHGSGSGVKRLVSATLPFWFPDVRHIMRENGASTEIGRFAAQWVSVNQFLSERGGSQPGYHRLKFEEMFDEHHTGLRQVCELLGLDYPGDAASVSSDEKINSGRLNLMGNWRTWSTEQVCELDAVCGPLMRQMGYGREPEWQAKLR